MKPTGERDDRFDRLIEAELARDGRVPGSCPQVELLAAWFDRSLPPVRKSSTEEGQDSEETAGIEAHLAGCPRCRSVVAALARTEPDVLYVHPKPARAPFAWHLRWLAPVGAAALIFLAVGSQLLRAPGSIPSAPSTGAAPAAAAATSAAALPAEAGAPVASAAAPALASPTASPAREQLLAKAEPPQPVASEAAKKKADEAPGDAKERVALQADARETRRALEAPAAEEPEGRAKTEPAGAAVAAPRQTAARAEMRPVAAQDAAASRPVSAAAPAAPPPPPAPAGGGETRLRLAVGAANTPVEAFAPGGRVGWRYERPGVVSRTNDGGETWSQQTIPYALRLSQLAVVSASTCWAAGPKGALARTTDATTWQLVTPPVPEDLVSLVAQTPARVTVRTAAGVTYETSDAGATWQRR